MKSYRTFLYGTLLTAALWNGAGAQESPWPMFRHDWQHTGRSQFTGPDTPSVYWTFQANDAITASPTIGHNGTIYVGAGGYYQGGFDSSLYALNPDGTLKWQYKTGAGFGPAKAAGIFSSVAVADDGTLYFGSLDEHVYALEDSVTYAKLRWKTNLGNWPVYSSPTIDANGNIVVGCLDFALYNLLPEDGTKRWFWRTNWCVFSSPALTPTGRIHVGSKDHRLYTFEDAVPYPDLAWTYRAGTFYDGHLIDCSPAIGDDGTIYFGTDPYGAAGQTPVPVDTVFFAVNPDSTLKWAFEMGDGAESSPAIGHDGTVYIGSYDSCVYAIEDAGSEGILKWKYVTGGPVDASPTVDGDGTVYIGSRDSVLYAFNPDGSVKWTFQTEGGIESSVTIGGDGYIYFGSFDGKLYALGTGAPDAGAESIDMPVVVGVGLTYTPSASVRNFRAYDLSFGVECLIEADSGLVYADSTLVTDLVGADSSHVVFDQWSVPGEPEDSFLVTVRTLLAGDDNEANDAISQQILSTAELIFLCGDVNGDGHGPNIVDLTYLVDYLFRQGSAPPLFEAADINGADGVVNIVDLTYLMAYLWSQGPEPLCE